MNKTNLSINKNDLIKLEQAVHLLESPSLVIQMSNAIAEFGNKIPFSLPSETKKKIVGIAESALHSIFDVANFTMEDKQKDSSPWVHKIAAAAAGGAGGFFGMAAILVELPISTTIMMRSILDIARAEGLSLKDDRTRLECIKVFGLEGNKSIEDDNAESGYYSSRIALDGITQYAIKAANEAIAAAAEKAAGKAMEGVTEKSVGETIIKLIQAVASRLGVTLTEQAAAKSIPILGAVAGSVLNTMFTNYYQDMARGHFTVIKLEEKYSQEMIQELYNNIYKEMKQKKCLK